MVLCRAAAVVVLAVLGVVLGASARGDVKAEKGAVRLVGGDGKRVSGRWQAWANASLVPTVRGKVTIRMAGCPRLPKVAGCVYTRQPRVVYVKRGLRNPRGVMLHELGHVYDLTVLSDSDRSRFRRIMGEPPSRQWWTGGTPLAEWFAEGYSWCARYAHIVSIEKYAIYRYRPTARQHQRVCALIKQAARDRRPPVPPKAPPVVTGDPTPPPPPPVSRGTIPGDPQHDPGPGPPEPPKATPTPTSPPLAVPTVRLPPVPLPTPTPTATASDDAIEPLPTVLPTPSPVPTESPEPTPTETSTPEPEPTPSDTPTADPEPTPTETP